MINNPTVEAMVNKLGVAEVNGKVDPASKYALCVVVSKRTRQILERERNSGLIPPPGQDKEIVVACKEIIDGKISYTKD